MIIAIVPPHLVHATVITPIGGVVMAVVAASPIFL